MLKRLGFHTVAFGGYLLLMTVALIGAGSLRYALLFACMLAALALLTRNAIRTPTVRNVTLAAAFFPVAINVVFPAMKGAVPAIRSTRFDHLLFDIDTHLIGGNVSIWLERLVNPALTEVMSFCYILFMPLLYSNLLRYFIWEREKRPAFFTGLFTIYGVGFCGYVLVPAAGPYRAFANLFPVPLTGSFITNLNRAMVLAGSNHVDVFPSLHCAVSAYILGFAYRHHKREFWCLLLPVVGLWVSTLYLRYHYFVDVVCGFILAALGLVLASAKATDEVRTIDNADCTQLQ
jgi:membrane-associated phospholipid phosphatase